jgi:hypothetical protein
MNKDTQFLYLHRFFFGGVTIFTAHLLYKLPYVYENKKIVLCPSNKVEQRLRDFGYGLFYKNISSDLRQNIEYPFLTVIKDDYFDAICKINEKTRKRLDNIIVVIHDPRDTTDRMIPYIKNGK